MRHVTALGNGNKELAYKSSPRGEYYTFYHNDEKVGRLENIIQGPTQIYQKIVTGKTEIVKVLENGKTGWTKIQNKVGELSRDDFLNLRLAASYSDLLGYFQAGKTFEIKGFSDVEGQPCYQVEIQSTLGVPISNLYVSTENYLVLKRESLPEEQKVEVFYDQFKAFNNINLPQTILVKGSQGNFSFKLDSLSTQVSSMNKKFTLK